MIKLQHLFTVIALAWGSFSVSAQIPDKWDFPERYDSLITFLADGFEDLHDVKIKVKEKSIGTTMAMRPAFFSLFKKPEKRTYVLYINNNEDFSGILIQQVPKEARAGIMAHELMHVRDYEHRNFFGLAERGWQYLSKRGKKRFEYEIDNMVMDAGFGFFLYAWKAYLMDESDIDDKYRAFKKKVYMGPEKVLTELRLRGEIAAPLHLLDDEESEDF